MADWRVYIVFSPDWQGGNDGVAGLGVVKHNVVLYSK